MKVLIKLVLKSKKIISLLVKKATKSQQNKPHGTYTRTSMEIFKK